MLFFVSQTLLFFVFLFQDTEWKDVKYSYNDGRLRGTVNGYTMSKWVPSGGTILSIHVTVYSRSITFT